MTTVDLDYATSTASLSPNTTELYYQQTKSHYGSPTVVVALDEPVVQFRYNGFISEPISLALLPQSSLAMQLALETMRNNQAFVDLNALYDYLDTEALHTVLSALIESGASGCPGKRKQDQKSQRPFSSGIRHHRKPHAVKLELMCAMRLVCDELGLDFDTLIRPRFFTFDFIERCHFATADGRSTLNFAANHVYIAYTSTRVTMVGHFAYMIDGDNCMRLFTDAHIALRLVGAGDIVFECYDDNAKLVHSERFVNQTTQRLSPPSPAVPSYY